MKTKSYSLQTNKKTRESAQHPNRDTQFAHINETVTAAIQTSEPVISVNTKKRELINDFKTVSREFKPKSQPIEIHKHNFKNKQLKHAIPYNVYNLATDKEYVSVKVTSETAQFAVNTIIS